MTAAGKLEGTAVVGPMLRTFLVAVLALGAGTARALAAGSETCTGPAASGAVTCTLSSLVGNYMIELSTVVSDAHAVNPAITSASPMVIVAFGGSGGAGNGGGAEGGTVG